MPKRLLAALTLTLIASPFTNAFTVISTEVTKGVVTKVDVETNTIELDTRKNRSSLALSKNAKFVIEGKKDASIDDLKEGHEITIKRRVVEKSMREVEGKVLSVDHETYIAKVRQADSKKVLEVHFSKDVNVAGETNQFTNIAAGQHISLRYNN